MTTEVWQRPQAEEDLLQIWLYVAERNVRAADKLIDTILEKTALLVDHPEIGPARPDIGANVRVLSVASYLVLYQIGDGSIEIVRVVHGTRDLTQLA